MDRVVYHQLKLAEKGKLTFKGSEFNVNFGSVYLTKTSMKSNGKGEVTFAIGGEVALNGKGKPKKEKNHYHFKGALNLYQVITDCLKEQRKAFVIVQENGTLLGLLKQSPLVINKIVNDPFYRVFFTKTTYPYWIYVFDKKDTDKAIEKAQEFSKLIRKTEMKLKRKLNKLKKTGVLSNDKKTKVMTF